MTMIKQLRDETGAGVMEAKRALEQAKGDKKKARELLKKKGLAKAAKRQGKETTEGQVYGYIHPGGRVGAMVKVLCETDFVARSDDFVKLCKELAMQVVSMQPKDVKALMKQEYIREPKKKVAEVVKETIAKVKENVVVKEFKRMSL